MVGKFFQEFFMFLINGEIGCRLELFICGCFERNGSAQNVSKRSCKREAYPYLRGTVPSRGVNSIITLGGVRDLCPAKLETTLRKMRYVT